jgi:hypothetical protein
VYYAGHGYEDNGENFLLPVDSDLKYNREHSLRTQEILEAMQQCDTSLNLLIIDACRVRLVCLGAVHIDRGGVTLWDRKRILKIFYNQVNQHSDTVTVGAFHLTEIPEILLENQMEHVNFWNAVSKIPDNLSRLSTNWKFRNFRNFYIPAIKTFPNQR